jgi:hypothetical protein
MSFVETLTSTCITVIDGRTANWRGAVDEQNLLLRNFLLLAPNAIADLEALGQLLGVDAKTFHALDLPSIYALKDYLADDDLILARLALSAGAKVLLIEQIDLPQNSPPHVPPFIVYCAVRGVISLHDSFEEAKHQWLSYNRDSLARGRFPEAKLYRWEAGSWYEERPN